ncbi:hypothetical protein DTW90_33405 [Neorhizobium sp. P12A]|nr:hypothetical protein DTW90_33405 [Neorhizobium sp. P12A]
MHSSDQPYTDTIDVERNSHVRYFADVHGLALNTALDLIRACSGNRQTADEAAIALKSHFTQSISGEVITRWRL